MAIHTYHPTSRHRGFVRVECTPDRIYYLRLVEHVALMTALDRGDEWYSGIDNFGVRVRFRLANVVGVETQTPEAIANAIAELEASKAEDRAQSDDEDGERWKYRRSE